MKTKSNACALVLGLLANTALGQGEDFLGGDDFAFDSSAIEVEERHWTDGFKTAIEHSHTQIPGAVNREQSSLQIQYEGNIAEGWYLNLDTRYRYFWEEDDLAENRGGAYGKNRWQRTWLQYSRGACSATMGRQTLIWGAVEGTFVTDIVSPFDYTEQLLTDYANVRLAQDMLTAECFLENSQVQVFYTPEALTDIYQHHRIKVITAPGAAPIDLSLEADEEWGVRFKWLGSGFDISLVYARLFDNFASLVLNSAGTAIKPELAEFDLYGVSSSIAVGRLLLKAEAAYRDRQLVPFTNETSKRYDAALGFEYTTSSNHILNAGLWGTHFDNEKIDGQNTQVLTVGWRKTYLNDDLAMSLLGNWSASPRFGSATILADYKLNDYWSGALAISLADLGELEEGNPVVPAQESATVSIKYEF